MGGRGPGELDLLLSKITKTTKPWMMVWLCFEKPFIFDGAGWFHKKPFHRGGSALLRKAQPLLPVLALLHIVNPSLWIGFASQSPSIMTDWCCFEKPSHRDRLVHKHKSSVIDLLCFTKPFKFPSWQIGFDSQSLFNDGLVTVLCKANPLWSFCFASQSISIGIDRHCITKPFHEAPRPLLAEPQSWTNSGSL